MTGAVDRVQSGVAYVGPVRVLVTGGAGFIGSAVMAALVTGGHEPVCLDLRRPTAHRIETVVADVRDGAAVSTALRGVDAVVHLAAKVGLEQGIADAPEYASHNDFGTAMLLSRLALAGIERVVLASSMVAYGEGLGRCGEHGAVRPGPRLQVDLDEGRFEPPCPVCGALLGPELVGEDAPVDPRNVYAATKVAQEHLSASWARQSGGTVAAMRFHNVYGPGLPLDTPYAGVAAIFRTAVLGGRAPQVSEDGGQRRDFVHVRDVARACVAALESDVLPGASLRAYNVGSGTPRTVLDLATALSAAAGAPEPVVTGRARLADVRHITASSARAMDELGWTAREDFAAAMVELLRPAR